MAKELLIKHIQQLQPQLDLRTNTEDSLYKTPAGDIVASYDII